MARALGLDPGAVLDLSHVAQPAGAGPGARWSPATWPRLRAYPDPAAATAALAGAMGVDPERLLLTNGGAEAIALVAAELGGRVDGARVRAAPPPGRTAVALQPAQPERPPGPTRRERRRLGRGLLPAGHGAMDEGRRRAWWWAP